MSVTIVTLAKEFGLVRPTLAANVSFPESKPFCKLPRN